MQYHTTQYIEVGIDFNIDEEVIEEWLSGSDSWYIKNALIEGKFEEYLYVDDKYDLIKALLYSLSSTQLKEFLQTLNNDFPQE